ncbi:MAG: hypothetical protein IJH47_09845 [Oscillospiraceae bacterium]|nr:hypothetical protein [Oscillospiraceae bacterium]
MDTARMRRVLERISAPAPPPPRPGPGGPPPPPPEKPDALLDGEGQLLDLCREMRARSRALGRELTGVERASRRRREQLERRWFLDHGDRPPRPILPTERRRPGVSALLGEAWRQCGWLEKRYDELARNAPDREQRRLFAALGRSAGESRRQLRFLMERAVR